MSFRNCNRPERRRLSFLHHFISFKREGGLNGAEEEQREEKDREERRKGKRIRAGIYNDNKRIRQREARRIV